jgi:hypothetical protein
MLISVKEWFIGMSNLYDDDPGLLSRFDVTISIGDRLEGISSIDYAMKFSSLHASF